MKKRLLIIALSLGLIGNVGCTKVEEIKEKENYEITLILDAGGVNDQSFNQSAWEGALRLKENHGVEISYMEAKQESDYATNIENAIDNNSDLVIGVGFKLTESILEASKNYPSQKFAIVDGDLGEEIPQNVTNIVFNEEEAGYCAGLVASQMTNTNKLGFIGGFDIASVTKFKIGFERAVKEENSDIKLVSQYANSFTDSAKGKAIAQQMISQGADILFTAGGGVNAGVFEAFGVDMPSNHIEPTTIITSALKNVGVGIELVGLDLINNELKGGEAKIFDLSNGGVGFEKTDLLSDEVIKYVEGKCINN